MPNLSIFLLLSFIGPGVVIFSALMLLWPELRSVLAASKVELYIFLVICISFLNGHLPFFLERRLFDRLWRRLHPALYMIDRRAVFERSTRILISSELKGYNHGHFDQVFGEFVLYFNTSFWLILICLVRIFSGVQGLTALATVVILVCSLVSILFTAPKFKSRFLSILDEMEKLAAETTPASIPVISKPQDPVGTAR
jgi:hypothetical protein